MKNQKGITLIALIFIVVVLLVLACISIALVLNNEQNVVLNPENVEEDISGEEVGEEDIDYYLEDEIFEDGEDAEDNIVEEIEEEVEEEVEEETNTTVEDASTNTVEGTTTTDDSTNTATNVVE